MESITDYKSIQLDETGLKGINSFWKKDLTIGFKAIAVFVNGSKLNRSMTGTDVNNYLPKNFTKAADP